jgi:molybdopterin synthase sulfur carrier subunit
MTHTVLLFASYADAFGPSLELDLPADATVATLLERLAALRSGRPLPSAMVAVNQRYARGDQRLAPGDEIAVIPPVAGG